ncbi:MAG: cytochrome c oxidase accessory protein CcoG [Oceanicoccus sp.]
MLNKDTKVNTAKPGQEDDKIPVQEIVEEFVPAGVAELDLYQKREKIYTRKIEGFYQRLRVYTGWPLLLGYFLVPWLNWDGRQAVLFDLPSRQFHIFNITFWPQDFPMLAWLLIIAAFTLFAITAWAGRIWCGYTCPQTVWTAVFMWAEQLSEGSRNQRIKRDKEPWSSEKIRRKASKHILWIGFAFLTGFTFVGYFSPVRDLAVSVVSISGFGSESGLVWGLGMWEFAWINFFTWATYINAGWMREQVCMYMCPYARFQSVMFDHDTLIVSYDEKRGEKRGPRRKDTDPTSIGLGDCVDCKICVQVCPTGIDIRDGLQYECINCALCIDGCNSVMEQMGYEKGLISYTTENSLNGKPTNFFRPRLIGYGIAVVVMVSLFLTALIVRVPLQLDVIRDRDRLYFEAANGLIENSYNLKILNMDQSPHNYRISVVGLDSATFVGDSDITVMSGDVADVPIRLSIDPVNLQDTNNTIEFAVKSLDADNFRATSESRFIGPRI